LAVASVFCNWGKENTSRTELPLATALKDLLLPVLLGEGEINIKEQQWTAR